MPTDYDPVTLQPLSSSRVHSYLDLPHPAVNPYIDAVMKLFLGSPKVQDVNSPYGLKTPRSKTPLYLPTTSFEPVVAGQLGEGEFSEFSKNLIDSSGGRVRPIESFDPGRGFGRPGNKSPGIQGAFLTKEGHLLSAPSEHGYHLEDAGYTPGYHETGDEGQVRDALAKHGAARINYSNGFDGVRRGTSEHISMTFDAAPSASQLATIEHLSKAHPRATMVYSLHGNGKGEVVYSRGNLNAFYSDLFKTYGSQIELPK